MNSDTDELHLREKAEKIVEAKRGFRQHLVVYVVVNMLIFFVWLSVAIVSDAWFPRFVFPLGGWGIGIVMHAYEVYGGGRYEARREELVRREMDRMKQQSGPGGGTG